jgi:hypothetical protein
MIKRFAVVALLPLAVSGCGFQAAVQGAGSQIGPAVMGIEDAIYSVAIAKYKSAQMFKAQIDGNLVLPPLPPPSPAPPTPTPTPVVPAPPVVVTPNPPGPIPAPKPVPTVP